MLLTKAVTGQMARSHKVTLLGTISTTVAERLDHQPWAGLALQPLCDQTKKPHIPQGARQLEKHQLQEATGSGGSGGFIPTSKEREGCWEKPHPFFQFQLWLSQDECK